MPAVSGDGLEKLEDMIVRAAESSAEVDELNTTVFSMDEAWRSRGRDLTK
jgi:hypothetical protein